MISIKEQMVSIAEDIPHQTVSGEIRPPVFPLDFFQIEDSTYQIRKLEQLKNGNYKFKAIVISR